MAREQNAVSIRVKHFESLTGKLEGTLEVDLVTPLNSANSKVPLIVDKREITLTVPLKEFYVRQLTGRYSFPIKLDIGRLLNQRQEEPSFVESPGVGTVVRRSGRQFAARMHADESGRPTTATGAEKSLDVNQCNVATIWLVGCIPITVVRQELKVVEIRESLLAVLIKVHPGTSRVKRVIIEAFDDKRQLLSRMNFPEVGPFTYGKMVELSFDACSTKQVNFIQSRLDVRLARDPTCRLFLAAK